MQDAQRNKVEQTEKARLRHKHALQMLQLEEVRIVLVWHFLQVGQRAKKVVSDSPGPVDFAIGFVNSVVNLPN